LGWLAGIIGILEKRECGDFFFKKNKKMIKAQTPLALSFTVYAKATLLSATCGTRENRK
jgi:hypothetical protein